MATHGAARQQTINALSTRTPFSRSGFAMKATTDKVWHTGRMDADDRKSYESDRDGVGIAYTVTSYATPIAWVTTDGEVKIPDTRYSMTTTHHQGLCRVYL